MSGMKLIEAIKEGNVDRVKELFRTGADINQHGDEQEWTALNYAAGKGDLEVVRLLVENGADVFETGRDNRTPYQIALAAARVEVARYLRKIEEKTDMEKAQKSSHQKQKYCKAYHLGDLRKFPNWTESRINWKMMKEDVSDDKDQNNEKKEFKDEDVVFIHEDYTVTKLMWHNENVIFNQVTPEWRDFCTNVIRFEVPDDIDMITSLNSAKNEKQKSS